MSFKLPKLKNRTKTYKDYLAEYKKRTRPTILEAMKSNNPNKWEILKGKKV